MKPNRCPMVLTAIFIVFIALGNTPVWAQWSVPPEAKKEISEDFAKRATAELRGKVIWEGEDLSQTTLQVYNDQALKDIYTGVTQLKGGEFEIRVEPGSYYLVAFVDLNRSGKFDVGDGMGIFGITDWNDPNQQKQGVEVADRQTIGGLEVIVTARMQDVDGQGQIVSVHDYQSSPTEDFKKQLAMISSGIKGQLTYAGYELLENALVFAYTDLSWKYRAGETRTSADGSFTLNLTPGKYYLMAIIDENNTNLFDSGDELGIYGVVDLRDRQAFPQPVLVKRNLFTPDIRIAITGRQLENGKIVSLDTAVTEMDTSDVAPANISGEVIWEGHSLKNTVIQIYRDANLLKAIKQIQVNRDGKFSFQLPPGNYYLMANVDADGDGAYSSGDGLGGYGTANITTTPPSVLILTVGKNPEVKIFVSAQYNADGQLEEIPGGAIDLNPDTDSGISGQIRWDGKGFQEGILSISETPDFQAPIKIPLNLEGDGRYQVALPPGNYYIMVVVDFDGDRKSGLRDGVGLYGTRLPVRGNPQRVAVFAEHITPHIDIEIFAMYIDAEGHIAEIEDGHRSEIKLQYGEPEDLFQFTRFGRQIEEWWYWTQGVRFTFEAVGAGWKLQNRKDFESKADALAQLKELEGQFEESKSQRTDQTQETTSFNALIYYSYDNVIWGYVPNGMRQPMGAGAHPTASLDGRLTYLDLEGNVILHDADAPQGRLLLEKRDLATDVALSPDGDYLAFARPSVDRRQLYIRHIPSQEEIRVPSTAQEMFTPAWNRSGELLAYSTKGSIENPEVGEDRNIYVYDLASQRIEPIRLGAEDDAEPTWSPSDPNLLAFSRADGQHRQIWIVEFSPDGEPRENQLTRYGGEKPVWLPDGSAVLYENNGQLWLVSKDATENQPLLVKGRVVFGHEPYASPSPSP